MLSEAITTESLDVITEPQIDSCQFDLGEPLKFTSKFEVRPEVILGDYNGVQVKVPEAAMPSDGLERALKSIAESKTSLQTIDPRPVKMGDTVLLDFECFVDNKLVEGGKSDGLVLEVKEGSFIEGFCEQAQFITRFADGKRFPKSLAMSHSVRHAGGVFGQRRNRRKTAAHAMLNVVMPPLPAR